MHTPNKWVVLRFKEGNFKVLGGWSGGYLNGDSWRLNSGITKVKENEDHYIFYGASGSKYKCYKGREGMTSLSSSIYAELKGKYPSMEFVEFSEEMDMLVKEGIDFDKES